MSTRQSSKASLIPLVKAITSCLQTLRPLNSCVVSQIDPSPLNNFSQYLEPALVSEVIRNQCNPYCALFFFNWASNPSPNPNNFSHTHQSYAAITDLLLSHSLFSHAESLLQNSNRFSDLVVSKLITAHGDRGNVKAALFWYHKTRTVENGRCLFSYNAILSVLVKNNKLQIAKSIFDYLVNYSAILPDASTYSIMIRGFCKMGMIGDARKVFDETNCEPTLVTFNTLINGYCKRGEMDEARSLFRWMTEKPGCLPDTVTYTTLIDAYCKKGEFELAMKMLSEMEMRDCKPNLVTYNALIYGLCMRGNVDEAKRLMTKMRLSGLKENAATHVSILKGLCVADKSDEAISYYKDMTRRGMKLDGKVYGVVVNEYCKMRKPDEAISLLKEVHAKGIRPSISSFNSVFRVLVEIGELDRAISVLKIMRVMNCKPNFISYNTVICSLCSTKGRMRQVEKLVNDMLEDGVKTNSAMSSWIVEGYCREGNEELALQAFYDTTYQNYVINLESFSLLVKLLCDKGRVTQAEKIFEDMCSRCSVVDVDGYRRVLDEQLLAHSRKVGGKIDTESKKF